MQRRAIRLLAAHDEHPELPPPAVVSADWPDDLAYQPASARGAGSRYSRLLTPELWLPCRFEFTVSTQDLTGEEVELGSSVALLEQLELLAARSRLEADPPEVSRDGHSLSAAAGNGLAVLRRLGARSVRSQVPMKLDFRGVAGGVRRRWGVARGVRPSGWSPAFGGHGGSRFLGLIQLPGTVGGVVRAPVRSPGTVVRAPGSYRAR
jgi:hypothetical protein